MSSDIKTELYKSVDIIWWDSTHLSIERRRLLWKIQSSVGVEASHQTQYPNNSAGLASRRPFARSLFLSFGNGFPHDDDAVYVIITIIMEIISVHQGGVDMHSCETSPDVVVSPVRTKNRLRDCFHVSNLVLKLFSSAR